MAAFLGILVSRALPLFTAMQIKVDRINQVMRETLSGVRVIRAFVRDDFEQRRFDEANEDLTDTARKVFRLFALMWPVADGRHEPLDGRGRVVRRAPRSRAARCPSAT